MIAEYEPNRKIVIQPTVGPIRLSAVRTVEPVASSSRATIMGRGQPHGLYKLLEPFVVWTPNAN